MLTYYARLLIGLNRYYSVLSGYICLRDATVLSRFYCYFAFGGDATSPLVMPLLM
jgi:hypothetical protein